MSHISALKSLVETTLTLILNDVNTMDNCEQLDLVKKLAERIDLLRQRRNGTNNKLLSSLTDLKSAVIAIIASIEDLNDGGQSSEGNNSTRQNDLDTEEEHVENDSEIQWYTEENVELQSEISQIKLRSNKFDEAMKYFKKSKDTSAEVFSSENERETKFTATKIRVVSEILGNPTNLKAAAKECEKYISELHKTFNIRRSPIPTWYKALGYVKLEKIFESQEMKCLNSAMHVNAVVFRFMKKFITTPIILLNWSTIDIASENTEKNPRLHHPILGQQPPKTNKPDPFSAFENAIAAASHVSAVGCNGEVLVATKNQPTEILRITPNGIGKVPDGQEKMILSISVDCVDCPTANTNVMESTTNEVSVQSSLASLLTPCKGKLYILTALINIGKLIQYFLYVTGMNADGVVQREELELRFLQSPELVQVRIFCIKEEKLIVLNVTKKIVYICNNQGEQFGTIDMTKDLGDTIFRKATIFTISYNGEIVCSEGRNKLAIYNIEEDNSSLRKADKLIEVKYVVQAVAFNHESDELVILCHTSVLLEYHLVIYTKRGELRQDIKLHNGNYREAKLIFNQNGRVVLLDDHKLLHLK